MANNNDNKPIGWDPPKTVEIPKKDITFKTRTAKVSFDTRKFDDSIKQQGVRVKIYRTLLCSDVKSIDGGEHNIDCTLCSNGFIDVNPICSWAIIQAQDLEKTPLPEGYYDANTVMGTFMQGVGLQYFTLVELIDHPDIFIERLKRQRGQIDRLKYRAWKIHIVIDSSGKQYYCGIDFDLDVNGDIKWKTRKGPLKGTIYSINYDAAIQFRAIKAAHVNRFAQDNLIDKSVIKMVRMNEQWVLQKEFLVERRDVKGNRLSPNLIRDPDED